MLVVKNPNSLGHLTLQFDALSFYRTVFVSHPTTVLVQSQHSHQQQAGVFSKKKQKKQKQKKQQLWQTELSSTCPAPNSRYTMLVNITFSR